MSRIMGLFAVLLSVASFAAETGMVYVTSVPDGVEVLIDGKEHGRTPCLIRDVQAGQHELVLRMKGADDVIVDMNVVTGQVARIAIEMNPEPATLTVISDPLGATVTVDMVNRGVTPITVHQVRPGARRVTIDRDDYAPHTAIVELQPGETKVYDIKLVPAPRSNPEERTGTGTAPPVPPESSSTEVQYLPIEATVHEPALRRLEERVGRGEFDPVGDPDLPQEAVDAVEALKERHRLLCEALRAKIGNKVVLLANRNRYEGELLEVTDEAATIENELKVDGLVIGKSKLGVRLGDIELKQVEQLADAWLDLKGVDAAQGFLALARGDADEVESLSKVVKDVVVRSYFAMRSKEMKAPKQPEKPDKPDKSDGGRAPGKKFSALSAGLVCYFAFDEGNGRTTSDLSGNGNDASLNGCEWVQGVIGTAARLKHDGAGITVRSSASLEPEDAITVAMWAKIDHAPVRRQAYLFSKSQARAGGYSVLFNHWFRWTVWSPVRDGIREFKLSKGPSDYADGKWHHYAFMYDTSSGKASVYLDGKLDSSRNFQKARITHVVDNLYIMGGGYWETIVGDVDEFRIYARALSEAEISALAAGAR